MSSKDILKIINSSESQRNALLINYSDTHAEEAYKYIDGNSIDMLYSGTRLNEIVGLSPILIDLNPNDKLTKIFIENNESQQGWAGLFITRPASCTIQQLAAQLRQRLLVRYDGVKEGLLHYSNPAIAQYFLTEANPQDTDQWLGAIEQLTWYYSTPWGGPAWQHYTKQTIASDNIARDEITTIAKDEPWALTHSQTQALQLPKLDSELTRHMEVLPAVKPSDANTWKNLRTALTRAKNLGLQTDNDLQYYLLLTCQYPAVTHNHAHLLGQANITPKQVFDSLEESIREYHYV